MAASVAVGRHLTLAPPPLVCIVVGHEVARNCSYVQASGEKFKSHRAPSDAQAAQQWASFSKCLCFCEYSTAKTTGGAACV